MVKKNRQGAERASGTEKTAGGSAVIRKTFEELQIRDDFMFSVIMRNPKFCKPFLERVLNIKIARIEYPRTQETIDITADAKGVRLDVYVEDGNQTVYSIEMQASARGNLPKRARYYQGMIDLNILEKGADYRELKLSFVIFVCTFDPFGEGRHIYTFENRCAENPDLCFGNGTVKIVLNTGGTLDDVTPELKKLLDFIDGSEPGDDFTRELDGAVEAARKNKKWRLDYMTLQMHYQEKYEEGMEKGMEQGIERGMERGIEQEKRQAALRMLKAGRFSSEEIAEFSGLTAEQVEELRKKRQSVQT